MELGKAFIGQDTSLHIESRMAVMSGDPREYHKYILTQRPYVDYANSHVPPWLKNAKQYYPFLGSGQILMTRTDDVVRDISNYVELLQNNEYLMVFINHVYASGYFPSEGVFHYLDYNAMKPGPATPVDRLKENIQRIKSISPQIKLGIYVFLSLDDVWDLYQQHPDWYAYDQDGNRYSGGSGAGTDYLANFSSGYREFLLDQLTRTVDELGLDWLHVDFGAYDIIDWNTRSVIQSYEMADFYDELVRRLEKKDVVVIQNTTPLASLWAHGSYFELRGENAREEKDWRILGATGYLATLYRTHSPGKWINYNFGGQGLMGIRSVFAGLRIWLRGYQSTWIDVDRGLAYDRLVDELLETRLSDAHMTPSWWRLQTDRLESIVLRHGQGTVIPLLLHGSVSSTQQISLNTGDIGYDHGYRTFAFDMYLSYTNPLNPVKPIPATTTVLDLQRVRVLDRLEGEYTHTLTLEPLKNYYHLLTQVPAWVYSTDGIRTNLLLPENSGVRLAGYSVVGSQTHHLKAVNRNDAAEIIAWVPKTWQGVSASVNGKQTRWKWFDLHNQRFILLDLPSGESDVVLASRGNGQYLARAETVYQPPYSETWLNSSQRFTPVQPTISAGKLPEPDMAHDHERYHTKEKQYDSYQGSSHRAYVEDGICVLDLLSGLGNGGVSIEQFNVVASGFSVRIRGTGSGARYRIHQHAGAEWTYDIVDDYTGWRQFNINKEQMTSTSTRSTWGVTTRLDINVSGMPTTGVSIGDIHLLAGDSTIITNDEQAERTVTAVYTTVAPSIDGQPADDCWKRAPKTGDFYCYGRATTHKSGSPTEVRMAYDNDYLYLYVMNREPIHQLDDEVRSGQQLFRSPHFHIFIAPRPAGDAYAEIGIDSANNMAAYQYRDGRYVPWKPAIESAVALNWKAAWQLEMRIAFSESFPYPEPGDQWSVSFGRLDQAGELSNWTCGAWTYPKYYGTLRFEETAK